MRPVLIISFLISMLILGWLSATQLVVLSGGVASAPIDRQGVTGHQPGEPAAPPSSVSPVDKAKAISALANERQREMEDMMRR
ncbi:MAG: hypothetical protein LBI74_08660 [Synergistaceae bacterium]|nr:hypothetical protein [Synergistaceae bacterium]